MSVDPKAFWEDKILGWEKGRYEKKTEQGGLLERIADASSNSLRFRIRIAVELLESHVKGRSVLELGCGSGIIAQRFIDVGATSYLGVDIAESAIALADQRKREQGWDDRVRFEVGTIGAMAPVKQDVVVSLGVLDWLTDEELAIMFERQGKADFLHAIAEKRVSLSQYAHRAYVHISYGRRTGAYRPRYFPAADIARMAAKHRPGPFYVYRDPRLSFGALISTLPIGPKIELR